MEKKISRKTIAWDIFVDLINRSTEWIPLNYVKESKPIDLSEYALVNNIDQVPAFKWWDGFMFNKKSHRKSEEEVL